MQSNLRRLVLLLALVIAAHFAFREVADEAASTALEPVSAAPETARRLGPCDVTHVTDGDTLNVRCGARKERVRLLQIDTAEREQPGYEEARGALKALIAGRRVELELGPEERDDHGRLLAYVFAGSENLCLAMIRGGWSPYFDRYGPGAYPREFAEAEREARARGLGIWAASHAARRAAAKGELR